MMNRSKVTYILTALVLLLGGCSKDLGNYNYQDVNKIEISGILEGDHTTDRIFEIPYKDTLTLNPSVVGTLSQNDMSNLEFSWMVDSVKVATSKDLIYVADKRYGRINAEFSVLDKSTGLTTKYNCFFNVVNPYKWGYYALTEDNEHNAAIYCLSTISKSPKWESVFMPTYPELGKNPITLSGLRQNGSSASDFYNILTLGVKDAVNPVVVIDSREFTPTLFYNSSSYLGTGNFVFNPTQVVTDPLDKMVYVVNNGKFYVLQNGVIPIGAFEQSDYEIAPNGIAIPFRYGKYFMSIYDQKNKKIRVWGNGVSGNSFVYTHDYENIPGIRLPDGQEFLACSFAGIPSINQIYLFKDGNNLRSYRLDYDAAYTPSQLVVQATGEMPAVGNIGYVFYDIMTDVWYMTVGNTIYSASYIGLQFQKFLSLPVSEKGSIVKFKVIDGKIMVAVNDSSAAKPGSIYIYNAKTMQLEQSFPNILDKIVDVHLGILRD